MEFKLFSYLLFQTKYFVFKYFINIVNMFKKKHIV